MLDSLREEVCLANRELSESGLVTLQKPMAHLHTQFNRDLPWATIDMDFMNLNQAAHGDREFGFICARMRKPRKVVVGHWQDTEAQDRLATWQRAAAGLHEMRNSPLGNRRQERSRAADLRRNGRRRVSADRRANANQ